jgi:hypothetical protein
MSGTADRMRAWVQLLSRRPAFSTSIVLGRNREKKTLQLALRITWVSTLHCRLVAPSTDTVQNVRVRTVLNLRNNESYCVDYILYRPKYTTNPYYASNSNRASLIHAHDFPKSALYQAVLQILPM